MVGRNIGDGGGKYDIEIDKSTRVGTLVIKNSTITGWHLWADEASSRWYYTCLLFYRLER